MVRIEFRFLFYFVVTYLYLIEKDVINKFREDTLFE